jgi:hypothetical protein
MRGYDGTTSTVACVSSIQTMVYPPIKQKIATGGQVDVFLKLEARAGLRNVMIFVVLPPSDDV